jgi:myo-inositol-1(or 4)-monophosphatase
MTEDHAVGQRGFSWRWMMDEGELDLRFHAAIGLVREVGQEAARQYRRREKLEIETKGLQDLVSEADRACEDEIVSTLNRLFPGDSFLGEERGLQNVGGDATWVIDPIDGTANFLRGIPLWCVSLGLIFRNAPVIGIIYNPVTDELYAAKRGTGATLNRSRIRVSTVTKLSDARMGIGFSYRRPVTPHVQAISALLEAHCEYSRLGSGALGMALTADGRLDGYWEAHINIWDVAAGLCIVKEAGGWTNDFMAGDVFRLGNPILAANPALAAPLSALLSPQDERAQ